MDPLGPEHPSPDKLAHFLAMGILAILVERSRMLPRGWLAIVCVVVWAWVDEWTQGLASSQRDASWSDIIAGWLGVMAAGVVLMALRPPKTASNNSPWRRVEATIDVMVARGGGGVLAAAVASLICIVSFPLWFAFFWNALGWSQASICVLLSLATGLLTAAPLILRSWNRGGGPSWPLPQPAAWLLAPGGVLLGWWVNQTLLATGLAGLGWSMMVLGAVDGLAIAVRLGWIRAERVSV